MKYSQDEIWSTIVVFINNKNKNTQNKQNQQNNTTTTQKKLISLEYELC